MSSSISDVRCLIVTLNSIKYYKKHHFNIFFIVKIIYVNYNKPNVR